MSKTEDNKNPFIGDIGKLCKLLEIKAKTRKNIKNELGKKLYWIRYRFETMNYITASLSAVKGGRSNKEFEYLMEKGLLRLHAERPRKDITQPNVLYKLTDLGVEAYDAYKKYAT